MSPEKGAKVLAEEILGEARREADRILKSAESERKTILESAKISSREHELRMRRSTETRGEKLREQILAEGRMRAKRERLQRREDLIAQVFQEIRRAVKKYVATKRYEMDLVRLVQKACTGLDSPEIQIRARKRDLEVLEDKLEKISEKIEKKIVLGKPITVLGGVVIGTPDGKVVIDETFDSRLERNKEKLRVEIAKALFQGSK